MAAETTYAGEQQSARGVEERAWTPELERKIRERQDALLPRNEQDQCKSAAPEPARAIVLLRQRAHKLRMDAAALDELADALPNGFHVLSPRANETLIQLFGQSHRVYLGR